MHHILNLLQKNKMENFRLQLRHSMILMHQSSCRKAHRSWCKQYSAQFSLFNQKQNSKNHERSNSDQMLSEDKILRKIQPLMTWIKFTSQSISKITFKSSV